MAYNPVLHSLIVQFLIGSFLKLCSTFPCMRGHDWLTAVAHICQTCPYANKVTSRLLVWLVFDSKRHGDSPFLSIKQPRGFVLFLSARLTGCQTVKTAGNSPFLSIMTSRPLQHLLVDWLTANSCPLIDRTRTGLWKLFKLIVSSVLHPTLAQALKVSSVSLSFP